MTSLMPENCTFFIIFRQKINLCSCVQAAPCDFLRNGEKMLSLHFQIRSTHWVRGSCRIPYPATLSADSMISGRFGGRHDLNEEPPKGLEEVIETRV